jgi:hypothetical protein
MKKSAVEWLEKELNAIRLDIDKNVLKFIDKSFEQAKEIYKQEIENSFEAGFVTQQWDKTKENKAEQYYNETFNLSQQDKP